MKNKLNILQITVVEDNSPVPDQHEESLGKQVEERKALFEATCQQVCIIYCI